ncbi:stage V sporulation protein AB [Clostridium sp. D2Q-11]|uniref:Stage V sporulation protein AB n=1 Tax=Anaeromonas frigoriresistens TaxID=2683708 RepID=A0A942UZ14_9FIRM|nr:stage V sporulation protein AB [Anaeromonas frigoriresistens]MBS4539621.1 stage V sporulation protein AB [Anaeromonas frigoriresistens]
MYRYILLIIIGIAGGITVGTAIASFLTLLDLVPRLAQVSDSSNLIVFYERVLVSSVVLITVVEFFYISIFSSKLLLIPIGVLLGAFIGLLAAALAEVLNVIPVLEKRFKLGDLVHIPVLAISLGKVIGSLLDWLILDKL